MATDDIEKKLAAANPVTLQRELFALMDVFFTLVVGAPASTYKTWDEALAVMKERATARKVPVEKAEAARTNLQKFYSDNAVILYGLAKKIPGLRLVIGGGSNYFFEPQLSSVRKTLLYADTVLIPDGVYERMTDASATEKYNRVEELHSAYFLLALKPIVDADLPYQAVFVFQSFEKSLEQQDAETQHEIAALIGGVMTHHLGVQIANFEELLHYARNHEQDFLKAVEKKHLFQAPGADRPSTNLKEDAERYRAYIKERRENNIAEVLLRQPTGLLLAMAISERFGPQYHLIQNAIELTAQPLLTLPVHSYYFSLTAHAYEGRLSRLGHLSEESKASIAALSNSDFAWLGNVPIPELVRLRSDNENEGFRRSLEGHVKSLSAATLEDAGKVATELAKAVSGMLATHQKDVRRIDETYQRKYKQLAVPSIVTAAAAFVPALAPIIGVPVGIAAAVGVAAKYAKDKHDEASEKAQQAHSLLGILATAKATNLA